MTTAKPQRDPDLVIDTRGAGKIKHFVMLVDDDKAKNKTRELTFDLKPIGSDVYLKIVDAKQKAQAITANRGVVSDDMRKKLQDTIEEACIASISPNDVFRSQIRKLKAQHADFTVSLIMDQIMALAMPHV
ncbi:MAG: hypothetical protein [Caudoviricetes sp.]|nr:MAG: hypothetical protein [Caudoviricetes sp.]